MPGHRNCDRREHLVKVRKRAVPRVLDGLHGVALGQLVGSDGSMGPPRWASEVLPMSCVTG